jgi:hypothetical protein
MTIIGPLFLASLYASGDAYSIQGALNHGAKETMFSMPVPARFVLEVGIFTGADLLAQKSKWKPLPWIVRGVEVGLGAWMVTHNLRQGRKR